LQANVHDRFRIGVVGAGAVAIKYHMPALRGVPEVVPTMVVDTDADKAQRFAERYCFPRWSTSLSDLIGNVDLAVIALPNWLHEDTACQLLAAGIHVLCEKPMARTVPECQKMIDVAEQNGSLLCIGHNRRFRPHFEFAKRLIASGQIGEIIQIRAEEGSDADWPRSQFYFDPTQSGGGALIDVGIHSIDLIRWLVGEFDELRFNSNGTSNNVESEGELQFTLVNGATGNLCVSRNRKLAQQMTIVGDEGSLELGLWGTGVRIRSKKGKVFERMPHLDIAVTRRSGDASFVGQLFNFVASVAGREQLLVDGREGMESVKVVRRAYDGLATETIRETKVS